MGRTLRLLPALVLAAWIAGTTAGLGAATRVVSVSPLDGATNVSVQAVLQVHFSNGLRLNTITADAIRLLNSAGAPVPAQLGSDIEADVVNTVGELVVLAGLHVVRAADEEGLEPQIEPARNT